MIDKLLKLDADYTHRIRIAEQSGIIRRLAILFAHSGDFLVLAAWPGFAVLAG